MKAVVTGAAGFVGSHLSQRLVGDGHEVVGIDSLTDYYDVGLKRVNARLVVDAGALLVEDDLNVAPLDEILEGADVVFHLAGQPGVRSSWGAEFSTYTRCNVNATQRLLEACRNVPSLRRFVYASSSSVYGNAERYPTSERDLPRPASPYGVTKLAAEHLCVLYAMSFRVPTVSLRYFTVYGPRQRPDMAFTRFAIAAAEGEEITVYGSGEQIRDFTYVDDVVNANILAALCDDLDPGVVLNVAGGSHTSVNEVLDIFAELSGSALRVKRIDPVVGDVGRTGGDTTTVREVLGWQPLVGLREGIQRQFLWASNPDTPSGTTGVC